jgi:hypothetical protein
MQRFARFHFGASFVTTGFSSWIDIRSRSREVWRKGKWEASGYGEDGLFPTTILEDTWILAATASRPLAAAITQSLAAFATAVAPGSQPLAAAARPQSFVASHAPLPLAASILIRPRWAVT